MKSKILTICLSLAVTLLASVPLPTGAAALSFNGTSIDVNLNATITPDHINLTWVGDSTTTQTISWRTISTDTRGKVQYRVKGTTTWTNNANVTRKLLTSGTGDANVTTGIENIFSLTIVGLVPGTIYEYQVIGTDSTGIDNPSSVNTFTTQKSNNTTTKFIVFGDSQSGVPNTPEYTP